MTAPHLSGGAEPAMIVAFEGWNDAGEAASAAIEHLLLSWDTEQIDELDPDEFYDFQVSRPTVHMVDGVTRRVSWPTTTLSRATPPGAGRDFILVTGPEPNLRWRSYCAHLLELAEALGVSEVITLGALLADTAHTRPVPVTGAAYDATTAQRHGLAHSKYTGPTGITGVFQYACVEAGMPALSLWAAVPHYVGTPPSPKASLALLRKLEEIVDIEIPIGELPDQADEWEDTVSQLAADDEEIDEYVRTLEQRDDAEVTLHETSGEQLAAEFERYLRRRFR